MPYQSRVISAKRDSNIAVA